MCQSSNSHRSNSTPPAPRGFATTWVPFPLVHDLVDGGMYSTLVEPNLQSKFFHSQGRRFILGITWLKHLPSTELVSLCYYWAANTLAKLMWKPRLVYGMPINIIDDWQRWSRWWLNQPLWKILVKLVQFPKYENQKCSKPPPRWLIICISPSRDFNKWSASVKW